MKVRMSLLKTKELEAQLERRDKQIIKHECTIKNYEIRIEQLENEAEFNESLIARLQTVKTK